MCPRPLLVSVIAPIYGVERYIEKFADSVLSQSYPHIEFIFVNDGTKDRSIEILNDLIERKYSHLKSRINIVNKPNGGLPAARRTGLEHATGDYIYHVDSDDWLSPDAIEKIVDTIYRTGADIVYFNFVKEYPNRPKSKRERVYTSENKVQYIRDMYNHRAFAAVWNKCVSSIIYTDNDLYTPPYGYAEDCCLTTQLVGYAKRIAYLDEELYHYRKGNPGALTGQQRKKRKREYALNFLGLYERYMNVEAKENPVACILDDIAIQAGWYSMIYGLGLFKEYKWLKGAIRKAKIRTDSDLWLVAQLLVKLRAWL